jgi:hypothetical protein
MKSLARHVIATCAYVAAVTGGHTEAMCSKPEAPSCGIDKGLFARPADYDECRLQMIKYKSGMEGYAECLNGADRRSDGQSARDELEKTLAQFNRKARGEQD